jgi:endonuclease I
MSTAIRIGLIVAMAGCLLSLAGCSKKADTNKSIADIQAEASKMNVEQLKAKATEYKDAIVAKKAELEKVAAKLKEIPITQQMGTEAKALQTDISNLSKAMADLTTRFQVYYNKLKEKGGSVAGLEI